MRRVALLLPAAALALAAVPASGEDAPRATAARFDANPCLVREKARTLRCPDLVMRRPFGLYVDRRTRRGRTLLRAGNSIDSVGAGPAELFGRRVSSRYMNAVQRIVKRGGGRITLRTGARLQFKYAHQRRRWWKFYNAARFDLWRLDSRGRRVRRVRRGPKVAYCLRDLKHTRPRLRGSPRRARYPACNTNPAKRSVVLGTSVGWSDVYPATYPEQWIDVTGLRGCFAYDHTADPLNDIYERNERNNRATVVVRLPFRPGAQRCPRAGRIAPASAPPSDPYGY